MKTSTLLNELLTGKEVEYNGQKVKWTKNEYSVVNIETGEKTFSMVPNGMSFWCLCQFLDLGDY